MKDTNMQMWTTTANFDNKHPQRTWVSIGGVFGIALIN